MEQKGELASHPSPPPGSAPALVLGYMSSSLKEVLLLYHYKERVIIQRVVLITVNSVENSESHFQITVEKPISK